MDIAAVSRFPASWPGVGSDWVPGLAWADLAADLTFWVDGEFEDVCEQPPGVLFRSYFGVDVLVYGVAE